MLQKDDPHIINFDMYNATSSEKSTILEIIVEYLMQLY